MGGEAGPETPTATLATARPVEDDGKRDATADEVTSTGGPPVEGDIQAGGPGMRNGRTPDERLLPDRKATLAGDQLAGCAVFRDNGPPKCPTCGNSGPAQCTCWCEQCKSFALYCSCADSNRNERTEAPGIPQGGRAPEPAVASTVSLLPWATRGGSPWGWLIPHNPRGGGPIPLGGRTIVIGREGDVKAPYNPHLSRCHVQLDWDGRGRVYATHLSTTNATWLNLGPMVRGQRVLVEPSWSNGPHQPMGVAPDAPIVFVSVVHASAARAMLREERIEGWCGWSICMVPGAYDVAADPPTPRTTGAAELMAGGGRQPEVRDGTTGPAAAGGAQAERRGSGTAPKRQRPLTADERGTTPAYPCARANSASEAYCQSCEMRPVSYTHLTLPTTAIV